MSKRDAIIVDIDGTLSDLSNRIHHISNGKRDFDAFFAECHQDACKDYVKFMCNTYGGIVILLTGRYEELRKKTKKWLLENNIMYNYLYMKPDSMKYVKDTVFKKEMYLDVISRSFSIKYAIDDRDEVLEMWSSIGIKAYHESFFNS